MELNLTDSLYNMSALIRNNPAELLEAFNYFEENNNNHLLQKLRKTLANAEVNVSTQLLDYWKATTLVEELVVDLQKGLLLVLEEIMDELGDDNYDLADWNIKYRERFSRLITSFYLKVNRPWLQERLKSIFVSITFKGLDENNFTLLNEFILECNEYCKIRRNISLIFGASINKDSSKISKIQDNLALYLDQIVALLNDAYSKIKHDGVLKAGFMSDKVTNARKKDIIPFMDKVVSVVFESEDNFNDVKYILKSMDKKVKSALMSTIVGEDKQVLSGNKGIEGMFYRIIRYAHQS